MCVDSVSGLLICLLALHVYGRIQGAENMCNDPVLHLYDCMQGD